MNEDLILRRFISGNETGWESETKNFNVLTLDDLFQNPAGCQPVIPGIHGSLPMVFNFLPDFFGNAHFSSSSWFGRAYFHATPTNSCECQRTISCSSD